MLLGIPISQQPHNYFAVASIVIWILQLLGVYYGKARVYYVGVLQNGKREEQISKRLWRLNKSPVVLNWNENAGVFIDLKQGDLSYYSKAGSSSCWCLTKWEKKTDL